MKYVCTTYQPEFPLRGAFAAKEIHVLHLSGVHLAVEAEVCHLQEHMLQGIADAFAGTQKVLHLEN